MQKTYQFVDDQNDVAGAELVNDRRQGPVLWVQTSPDGCYVPVERLDEFIDGLRSVAASATANKSA